jgi:predicted nucleic acid-binding protein
VFFVDTSALVKAYLEEPGSEAVREIVRQRRKSVYVSNHVALETLASFASNLRRQVIRPRRYRRARSEFLRDYPGTWNIVEVSPQTVDDAMQLTDVHRGLGVGGMDLLHIATAEQLAKTRGTTPTIVCADRAMRNLAAAAGFRVFNPETDDPITLAAGG